MSAMTSGPERLPRTGIRREALREKGQFWTPDWVAEAMVRYVVGNGTSSIFDPAVGAGAFFTAAKNLSPELGRSLRLVGTEIDPAAIGQAQASGLSASDLRGVQIRDFVLDPPQGPYESIVANPPYIRHHRLSSGVKSKLRDIGKSLLGKPLDGRAGLHVYFLIRALRLLQNEGRLAFIMPADTCEGVFSEPLWRWITSQFRLEGVLCFSAKASPFPGVDTNPVVFLVSNNPPAEFIGWARCEYTRPEGLKEWITSGFKSAERKGMVAAQRSLKEALSTGLSRKPLVGELRGLPLRQFATVVRGIATGANDYFFLTSKRARELGIPEEFLIRAVGRTRDVLGDEITEGSLAHLEETGRPTQLFSPDARPIDRFPRRVQEYLRQGEELGLAKRTLIAMRRPWYKMEARTTAPPILFSYLGRRNARFIRNRAGVRPLTGFLCVYPRSGDFRFTESLWEALHHPDTLSNLALVGKSYGSGAIKVEPRALERLLIPEHVLTTVGLQQPERKQAELFPASL